MSRYSLKGNKYKVKVLFWSKGLKAKTTADNLFGHDKRNQYVNLSDLEANALVFWPAHEEVTTSNSLKVTWRS